MLYGIVWNRNNILYTCDYWNHKIISYSIDTRNLSTLAGNGIKGYKDGNMKEAQFKYPYGITMSDDDTIYDVAEFNYCIRRIKNGIVSTIAGIPGKRGNEDGPINQSMFSRPYGLILDDDGNLLVGDDNGLRKVNMNEKIVSTLQGIPKEPIFSLTKDNLGSIYIGSNYSIFLLENTWKWERFLWIGWMKENSNNCFLSKLPKEIIKEIASHLSDNLIIRKRTIDTLEDKTFKKQKT